MNHINTSATYSCIQHQYMLNLFLFCSHSFVQSKSISIVLQLFSFHSQYEQKRNSMLQFCFFFYLYCIFHPFRYYELFMLVYIFVFFFFFYCRASFNVRQFRTLPLLFLVFIFSFLIQQILKYATLFLFFFFCVGFLSRYLLCVCHCVRAEQQ